MRRILLIPFMLALSLLLPDTPSQAFHPEAWEFHDMGKVSQDNLDVPMDINDSSQAVYRQMRRNKPPRCNIHTDGRLTGVTMAGLDTIFSIDESGCVTGLLEDNALFRYCEETGITTFDNPCEAINFFHTNSSGAVAAQCSSGGQPDRLLFIHDGQAELLDDFGYGIVSVSGLNDANAIIGQAVVEPGMSHAFVVQDGEMRDLDTLGGPGSASVDINNLGAIVGNAMDAEGVMHAFVWNEEEGMLPLGPPDTPSSAFKINDSGIIVGEFVDASGITRAFLQDETFHPLSPDNMPSSIMDLNEQGAATGLISYPDGRPRSGFFFAEGMLYSIPCLPYEDIFITPLPGNKDVVGTIWLSDGNSHAFHYSPVFGYSPLSQFAGVDYSWQLLNIQAINAKGELMGIAYNYNGDLHVYMMARP